MPHSFLFGHLVVFAKLAIKKKMPRDASGQSMPLLLAQEYPEALKAGCIYMDVWPISAPMLAVFHPDMMAQFTQEDSQLKHPYMHSEFLPFTGAKDLVCSEGREWKAGRAIFNPGFSTRNLLSLIPNFIEEVLVFRDHLFDFARKGNVINLEHATTNLTVDIIARAVLGARVNAQNKPVKFLETMLDQVKLLYFDLDLKKALNPLRPFRHHALNRTFRNEMMPYVQHAVQNYEKIEGPKTILNLALKSYVEEVQDVSTRGNIPPEFLDLVINHIKMFLFAGHDTTATTMAYAYFELYSNSSKLALLRAEHDSVLGTNVLEAASRIAADPTLLNQMPYTLAVVKETLRLWPVVGTVRIGSKGFMLHNRETGVHYPAEGFMLFGCSAAAHRNPNFWPDPDVFIPERWTIRDENDPLHPVKNSFRPWEQGPRNCIGQELASLELRLILALTIREFDMEIAYPEDAETFQGIKHYQIHPAEMITAHPKGGMPVRVNIRS
ncbi:cytochrome P450 [Truncatella angustata]|uniref:Cytochrome P450 n=1 Tax=Truncatella angustata TaxID=152316 RepID=A0A9P8UC05_9PEZI|nr:cytochrome P450 [Truncatella angustata]KAH6646101.1 cytochrome P450 [Truncatella angustata]